MIRLGTIFIQIFLSVLPFQSHSDFGEIQTHSKKISEPIWTKFLWTIVLQGIPGMIPMGVLTGAFKSCVEVIRPFLTNQENSQWSGVVF